MKTFVQKVFRRLASMGRRPPNISTDYRIITDSADVRLDGWLAPEVARRQHRAYAELLEAAREGSPRVDFAVAGEAVRRTRLANPRLLEVGCGSGYYSEVLPRLAGPMRYVGVDYSVEMVKLARRMYRKEAFVAGDARRLPFADATFEIVVSGNSLMHIAEYQLAIEENVRVSASWCVFHTVPVIENGSTTFLTKRAYGEPVVEVVFNRSELEATFARARLRIEAVFESIPYDVSAVLNERNRTLTYLCRT